MKIKVNLKNSYEIRIKEGIITNNRLPKGFVVTDWNIKEIYDNLLHRKTITVIEANEKSKSIENYCKVISGIGYSDAERIIAFGGGVVGDLAGFVASTYKRGIKLIHAPTSLLAMVDSSIGGKNGVNDIDRQIKNYIGTIYQPEKVIIDPLLLRTLPEEEFRNGTAEIIKYAAVFDSPILERLQRGLKATDTDLEKIIAECCKTKARVVEKDEFDKGYRHTLNFGHTIGHAIELLYQLKHGEAISIGMANELRLGSKIGLVSEKRKNKVIDALKANNLPTEFPSYFNAEKVLGIMQNDKKGGLVFAFDRSKYNVRIEEKTVEDFLRK